MVCKTRNSNTNYYFVNVNHCFLFIDSPQFYTHPPVIQVVQEFSLLHLECSVHSYPTPQIEWFYVNDNVTRFNLTDDSTVEELKPMYQYASHLRSRLLFNNGISRKNSGIYVCSVHNALFTEEAYTDIKVECK